MPVKGLRNLYSMIRARRKFEDCTVSDVIMCNNMWAGYGIFMECQITADSTCK